ncbi:RrF2 family transcriptional regulator [Phaeobacter inhibens]|uniref:RrF2 family transcriptional regulator n=1 Tax=Phaeobacter inhibens TaxID=221822 RepID=UPI000C9AEA78|nr:Rrf2 family transcriptional regulator [Phaeobacter inhibens]AUQ65677.1 putative HTH-type transcriptional regulator [Phaeobacter inhibens]AUR08681.1 putative HTH-type transcriptional regulator [Phaeobacter inhibens]UWR59772.1 Rrf2 family transcriptional regulator [Phaeobacter inhibens]UWR67627.1 Rrf2 family transcriptional regulator [Phaeobacter inhibens]UWR75405.1 Rrf2 family transcriptional regulator [Phaeobacter inhibens]
MRITKRTNIAVRLLMYCAAHADRLVTKSEIAARCNISENHLAQVINQLAQLGYLHTQRGRNGGMSLGKPAAEIGIGDVFRDVEGTVPMVECFADADNTCPLVSACRLRLALSEAAQAFYQSLDGITLEALICDNDALFALFQPPGVASCARYVN